MPEVFRNLDFTDGPKAEEPKAPPTAGQGFGAGFELENDVAAAIDLMSRPVYEEDPTWRNKLAPWLKQRGLWEDYRNNFLGSKSEAEAAAIEARIRREGELHDTYNRSGWAGTAGLLAGGFISPTMLLPYVGGARGLKAFATAAAYGALGGTLQEIPLQAAQETRTPLESVVSVSANAVLAGILGGATKMLTPAQFDEVAGALRSDMAAVRGNTYGVQAAGAQASRSADAGKFASSMGAIDIAKGMSPVMRTIQQDVDPDVRWLSSQMSDAGLRLEKNAAGVATAPLGTIENLTKTWYGNYAKGVEAIDENYAAFVFDGNVPGVAANTRALARGAVRGGEYAKATFREEVAKAMRNGDAHPNPYVAKTAQALRKEVFDPLLKEAQTLGVIPKELGDVKGDVSYLFRDYNRRAIEANLGKFLDILSGHFEKKLVGDFAKKAENFRAAMEKDKEAIAAMKMKPDEVDAARAAEEARMRALEEAANTQHLNALEDSIANLRATARQIDGTDLASEMQKKQMLADAREMERSGGEALSKLRIDKAAVRRRMRNLNQAQVVLEEKVAKKLAKVEAAEDNSLTTLKRMVKKASALINDLEGLSDAAFEKRIEELKGLFMAAGKTFDKGEERLTALIANETDPAVGKILGAEALQAKRANRLTEISDALDHVENLDRADIRAIVEDGLQEVMTKAQGIVERRAVRNARLREQAAAMTPEDIGKRVSAVETSRAAKLRDLEDKMRVAGASYIDVTNGTADFAKQARKDAGEVAKKIMGVHLRLPAFEVMQGERGAELARVLDIPSADLQEFLENDVEKLTRRYLRTMAPDVEMARKFGTVNAEEQFAKITQNQIDKMDALRKELTDKALAKKRGEGKKEVPSGKKGPLTKEEFAAAKRAYGKGAEPKSDVKLTPEELKAIDERVQKESLKLADQYKSFKNDLTAVMGRLRHTWGLPDNPEGMAYRMARFAMNMNVLRMMGGVVVSSFADVARPVTKYGVVRTFRDGFVPLISNLKALKMSMKEVQLAGGALDVIIHSRSQGLTDILDDLGRGSKFERGVEYLTNKTGIVAGFDYWTSGLKQFHGAIANARAMDALKVLNEGGSAKEVQSATTFLAEAGIDAERARDMWQEVVQNNGGAKVNGVWLPNTESWKNPDNVRAYRSLLVREVDNGIVTPGVERPLWMDATMTGRMLGQFKSYSMSATSKVLLSGLQQRDMAFVNGVAFSLGLGALSYYTWARARGGEAETEMMNAGLDKWADEAIDRSGVLAAISTAQQIAQRIPAVQGVAGFSGTRSTRRGGGSLVGELGGPSYDLLKDISKVLTEIDDPNQSTANTIKSLLPFNNVTILSRAFEAAANSLNLPENRQ